jgi:hypothetical protein
MIKDIFDEFFGKEYVDELFDTFRKVTEKYYNSDDKNEEDEKEESYYHRVADTYENGEHTSHVEKEVKNGEVLKDVNETYKIEDKSCEKGEDGDTKDTCCKDNQYYEDKLKEANDLLDEARETIKQQGELIQRYQEKLGNIEKAFLGR